MKKGLFLDRDGILNKVIIRGEVVGSPRKPGEFELIDEAIDMVSAAKKLDYFVVVVTNQPDVDRGYLNSDDLETMHQVLSASVPVDKIEVCTSSDDTNSRRKPNPGMILEAADKYRIDLNYSFMVGDGRKDILAGQSAGVNTILLDTGYNGGLKVTADYVCRSISEVINILEKCQGAGNEF